MHFNLIRALSSVSSAMQAAIINDHSCGRLSSELLSAEEWHSHKTAKEFQAMAKESNLNLHLDTGPFRTRTLSKSLEFGRGAESNKHDAREAFDPDKLTKKLSNLNFLYEFT